MKRIILFLATNLAIMVVLGIFLNVLLSALGISHGSSAGILILALVFGMGGSFISLAMSKSIAKWSTGAQLIEQPSNAQERWLLETVSRQAKMAGIQMPEVAIFNAPEPNAFATGMSRNSSLVAVSTGLLHGMTEDEVEAVLAHEISHAANGDMVTLALIQGVMNTFVILLARILGGIIDSALSGNNDSESEESTSGPGFGYFITVMVLEIILGFLASIVVMWFSRYREFHADAGGAKLAGRDKMIAALDRLRRLSEGESNLPSEVAAFGISGKIGSLFSTHPPLEERIRALQEARY